MKRLIPILLLLLAAPGLAGAQSDYPGETDSDEEDRGELVPETEEEDPDARSVTPFLRDVLKSDVPVTLEADRIEYDNVNRTYQGFGNVVLFQEANELRADRIVLDLSQNVLIAEGNIRLRAPEGEVTADALRLAIDSETAVIARAEFKVIRQDVTYFLSGRRIEKVGPDRYLVYEGRYTTCDCGVEEADWVVTAKYIDVTFDGYAVVEHGRIYTQGLAVAYLPYGIFPAKIKRSTGFLWPTTGWASDDGYRFGVPFYMNINKWSDATLYTDWYEKRGFKFGLEHRYLLNREWYGQTDVDFIQDSSEEDARRWALGYKMQYNIWQRLYLRYKVNLISDIDYVNDFPRDISARYDRYIRSDVILNNLWQNYDLNVSTTYWDDLANEDNSYTWQHAPRLRFDSVSQRIGPLPVYWRVGALGTNFYREKISSTESDLDVLIGHQHPYTFLSEGRRVTVQPEVHALLNFSQVATFTPYAKGEGTFYQLNDREEKTTPARGTAEVGGRLYTRFERAFRISAPALRGIKHQIEPSAAYAYRDEPDQDDLPIFDGDDRWGRLSTLSYGLTNRLFMRLFDARGQRYQTFKLSDVRLLHGYDFAEAERALDPLVEDDERRPWQPWRLEVDTLATAGSYLDKILARSTVDYDTYLDKVSQFSILGALGTVHDDALGVEYRYHADWYGVRDIDFISGIATYNLVDFVTFDYLTRYSFIDNYFIETRYGIEFHSLQNCWNLRLNIEQREIPEKETVYVLLMDFTGLVQTGTAF